MKKLLNNKLFGYAPYVLLVLVTTAIVFTAYAVKGIFPFGDGSIAYADFAQSYVPQFYHYWDVLHGLKSPFFDWYSGTGIGTVSMDIFSPFNLFFLFIPRDFIFDSMSFFLLIKVVVSALTFYFFINKVFNKVDIGYKLGFSALYALSGYVLQYYTNIKWLDVVAVFPLLMLSFYYLMKKDKLLPYLICFALVMLSSFYLSVQVAIFLLFTGTLYILFMVKKGEKKYKAFNLALGTALGIGITMFKSLPSFITLMGSSRGEGNASYGYFQIINVVFKEKLTGNDINKWFMLLGLEMALVICIALIARFAKHKRATLFFVSEVLVICVPIIFEGVNKLWHTGSYVGFPIRAGFLMAFVFLTGACYCLNFETELKLSRKASQDHIVLEGKGNEEKPAKKNPVAELKNKLATAFNKFRNNTIATVIMGIFSLTLIGFTVPVLLENSTLIRRYGCFFLNTENCIIPLRYLIVVALVTAATILIVCMKKMWLKSLCIVMAILVPLSINTYAFIGVDSYVYSEQKPQFLDDVEMLDDLLPAEDNVLNRVKVQDNSLNTNYPFIIQRGSMSNWTHNISADTLKSVKSMGYSSAFTRMLDTGGTLLTDAVLGMKNTISRKNLSSSMYTLQENINGFNYYLNNYTLPTCIVADESISEIKATSSEIAKVNNDIYHSLSSDTENIMEGLTVTAKLGCFYNAQATNNAISFAVKITGNKAIYFKSGKKGLTISVDGKPVEIPSYTKENNLKYTADFNNNLINLGVFTDGVINVTVSGLTNAKESDVSLYVFDMDKLNTLCQQYNSDDYKTETHSRSLSVTANADTDGKVLFIPVCYDKGWSATVNGKSVEVQKALNSGFMAVPLEKGENQVELTYFPVLMKVGIVLTVASLAVIAGYVWLRKRKDSLKPPKAVAIFAQALLYAIWFVALVGIYIIPVVYQLFFTNG